LTHGALAFVDREAARAEDARVGGVGVHQRRRAIDAEIVGMAGKIEQHVAELVRQRERTGARANRGPVENDDVLDARTCWKRK
jgi:hypothetical protein